MSAMEMAPTTSDNSIPASLDESFFAFLDFYQHVCNEIERVGVSLADRKGMQVDAAKLMHISLRDFQQVAPVAQKVHAELKILDREGQAYITRELASGRNPSVRVLASYERRRQATSVRGQALLREALGSRAFTALMLYIRAELGSAVRIPVK